VVWQQLAGEGSRWSDRPPERHAGAELDPFKPHLIHQPAQQPQAPPASAQLIGVGIGWGLVT
jgi:hypothetical protein